MNKLSSFLNAIPNWLVTIAFAVITTFITLNVNISQLETKVAYQDMRLERLEQGKIGKEVADEWNKRFDRIENKIDRLVEDNNTKRTNQ